MLSGKLQQLAESVGLLVDYTLQPRQVNGMGLGDSPTSLKNKI